MVDFIDLDFQRTPRAIAAAFLRGDDGITLIDPGPTSCLEALESGLDERDLELDDVCAVLLTHIHLDHAGAAGTIAARVPGLRVYVHEIGAPHLVDPTKLLASATRLYGSRMDELWGAFLPVPAERMRVLKGDERLRVGGRTLRVAYTPGHAKHHLSYLDEQSGVAYVGDTGGVSVAGHHLIAATPPPDIDLEVWEKSLDLIEAWEADAVFLTHFGPVGPAREHLDRFRICLRETGDMARTIWQRSGSDEERQRAFVEELRQSVRRAVGPYEARAAETAAPFDQIWQGLARYWSKRGSVA